MIYQLMFAIITPALISGAYAERIKFSSMLVFSVLMFARFIYIWAETGIAPELTMISWLFSFGLGFNSIAFAMWFDYDENKHLAVWSSSANRRL